MFPDARVSRFEKVGHFVADEGEELLAADLKSFLQHAGTTTHS